MNYKILFIDKYINKFLQIIIYIINNKFYNQKNLKLTTKGCIFINF